MGECCREFVAVLELRFDCGGVQGLGLIDEPDAIEFEVEVEVEVALVALGEGVAEGVAQGVERALECAS